MPTIQKIRGILIRNKLPIGRNTESKGIGKFTPSSFEVKYFLDSKDGRVKVSYHSNRTLTSTDLNIITLAKAVIIKEGFHIKDYIVLDSVSENIFLVI